MRGGGVGGRGGGGDTQPSAAANWEEEEMKKRDHSPFLLSAQSVDPWDFHNWTPSPNLRRPPPDVLCFLFVLYSFCQTVFLFSRWATAPSSFYTCRRSLSSLGPSFFSSCRFLLFLPFSTPPFSPPPLLNMALTGGEAGLFLHVRQVLPLLHPLIIPGSLYHRVALHAFQPSSLSFHPPLLRSLPPLGMVSGVGPSLCAKVPPVYRAPDFPPALLFNWTFVVWFFFITFFKRAFLLLSFFSGRLSNSFFNAVSSASNISPSDWMFLFFLKRAWTGRENLGASITFIL